MIEAVGDLVPKIHPTAWVHPRATVMGDVEIGPRSSVWPGAVLRGDFGAIRVGAMTSIQDNAVLHAGPRAPTVVGDECVIAHQAFIETAVVEDVCMVAVGAKVLPGAVLRRGAVAAAGAVLVGGLEVPGGKRAVGVPARLAPNPMPDEDYIREGARNYAELAARLAAAEAGRADGTTENGDS